MTDQELIETELLTRLIRVYHRLWSLAVRQGSPLVLDRVRIRSDGMWDERFEGEWIPCTPGHLTALLTHTAIVEEAERIVAGELMLN